MENTRDSVITQEESSINGTKILSKIISKEIGEKTRLVSTKLPSKLCGDLITHLRKVGNCNKILLFPGGYN